MKAREAIEKTQHENRIMEAIKDAGREDLLDGQAVIIPAVGLESAVVWFDDSYNTMIESGGEWIKPSGGEWLKQAREYVLAAGYVWHYDCEPPEPASAYIPEPAAGYGWRSKAVKPAPAPAGHTPGPWRVGQDGHNILTDNRGDRPTMVASIQHEIGQGVIPTAAEHAEAHANASLIAASPELLSACKAIVRLSQDQGRRNLPECAAIARAAIAKAEGGAV